MTTQEGPRILMCGGRDFGDLTLMTQAFFDIAEGLLDADGEYVSIPTIVHGAARGADTLAGMLAEQYGWNVEAHPADWDTHGRAAGVIRNQQMLDTGIDHVVAFPGGRGTADMVRRAQRAGVPVTQPQAAGSR